MLVFSMTVSVDGFVADRDGSLGWTAPPSDAVFRAHLDEVRALGGYLLGRRLYEAMQVWETDPGMRATADRAAFADAWCALPKVVFSSTLETVGAGARLATGTLAEEVAAAHEAAGGRDVQIGGPRLAGAAFAAGLVDELRLYRAPVVVGGGTPYLPPVELAVPLELVQTRSFEAGMQLQVYRRTA